jgi:hypothetical protein
MAEMNFVTDQEERYLEAAGYEFFPNIEDYADYEQYPEGFGDGGLDRIERIFKARETGKWTANILHQTADNQVWYDESQDFGEDVTDAIAWVNKNRKVAPKTESEVS